MEKAIQYFYIVLVSLVIAACGGGGGGGSTAPTEAAIDSTNARTLGITAMEGARQAVSGENTSTVFRPAPTAAKLAYIPVPFEICSSGSATIDEPTSPDAPVTISYNSCTIGTGENAVTADGVVVIQFSSSGDTTTSTTEYQNFTVTSDGITETLDLTVVCTTTSTTSSCTFSAESLGLDGTTVYTVSNAEVSGDDTSGWDVSVKVENPDIGFITIETTTPISFNCPGGYPSQGVVEFTDANGVLVTVEFDGCDKFIVSYSGTSEVYFYNEPL